MNLHVKTGRCVGCGRKVKRDKGEFLFFRPDGSDWWIHHRKACRETYNPDVRPTLPQERRR